jgi:hypothetical protein
MDVIGHDDPCVQVIIPAGRLSVVESVGQHRCDARILELCCRFSQSPGQENYGF